MGRIKLIALLVLLTSIVIVAIIIFKFPGFPGNLFKKQAAAQSNQSSLQVSRIPGPDDFVQGAKDFVSNQTKKTAENVAQVVNNQKQQVITQVLGTNDPPVVITIPASSAQDLQSSGQDVITMDFAKNDTLNLKLKKGTKYYIQFKNVPGNTCFYINETKYQIENDKILQIEFQKSGSYKLSTNSCELNFKEMGSFSVDD
jgi:hypothetical protein